MKDTSALEKSRGGGGGGGGGGRTTTGHALTQTHFKTNGLNAAALCGKARRGKAGPAKTLSKLCIERKLRDKKKDFVKIGQKKENIKA